MARDDDPDKPHHGPRSEVEPALADPDGFGLEALWKLCEPATGEASDPLLGREIEGVRLVRVLGEGGMGRVYEGERDGGDGQVAVKVLRPGLWSRDLLRRFAKESEILRRLDHPGISRILAVGSCDVLGTPVPAIVMELVPGALPITDYVRTHALGTDAIVALMARVSDAVAHGHALGIVHRDLKPGNVLVSASGEPKVIDFGVARGRLGAGPDSTLTAPGGFIGTLPYMSPEQVDGDGAAVDARSDVHALGALLHELLTGTPPFDIVGLPVVEAARVIRETPAPRAAGVSPGLAAIIERCLEKHPARRYADAGGLAAALGGSGVSEGWLLRPGWLRLPRFRRGQGRRGELVRGTFIGLLLGAMILFAVQLLRDWSEIERYWGEAFDGMATVAARLGNRESLVFEHAFRTIEQFDADRWLVASPGMKKWAEEFSTPRITYWGPTRFGEPGTLDYRFVFPVAAERIELVAETICWDFDLTPELGKGRGATKIEVSRDGETWITLHDGIAAGKWGESSAVSGDLPASATGTRELWLRVTLLAEVVDGEHDAEYTVAQFARSSAGATGDVFSLRAYARGVPVEITPAP